MSLRALSELADALGELSPKSARRVRRFAKAAARASSDLGAIAELQDKLEQLNGAGVPMVEVAPGVFAPGKRTPITMLRELGAFVRERRGGR
jgi:hypothetical protein